MKANRAAKRRAKREGNEFLLTVSERFGLINILPDEGHKLDQHIVRSLVPRLMLTDAERKKCEWKETPTEPGKANLRWNNERCKRRFTFSDAELVVITDAANRAEQSGTVKQLTLDAVTRFSTMDAKKTE